MSPGGHAFLACIALAAWQAVAYFRGELALFALGIALSCVLVSLTFIDSSSRVACFGVWAIIAAIGFLGMQCAKPDLLQLGIVHVEVRSKTFKPSKAQPRRYLEIVGEVVAHPRHSRSGELTIEVEERVFAGKSLRYLLKVPATPGAESARIVKGSEIVVGALVFPLVAQNGRPPEPFSYYARLYRKGVAAYGYIKSLKSVEPRNASPAIPVEIYQSLWLQHGGSAALSVVCAATLGMKDLLGRGEFELFQKLGLSHLLVVSGFHLGIVWVLVSFVLKKLLSPLLRYTQRPIALYAAFGGGLATWGYALLIQGGLSTFRALIAVTIVVGGGWVCRGLARRRAIGGALFICIAANPGCYFGAGLQLTFAALSGLWVGGCLCEVMGTTLPFRKLCSLIVHCFCAWLYTSPIVLFHYGYIVPAAPIYNLIIAPVFSLVVIVGGFIGILLTIFGLPAAHLVLGLVLKLTAILLELIDGYSTLVAGSVLEPLSPAQIFHWPIIIGLLAICAFLWAFSHALAGLRPLEARTF